MVAYRGWGCVGERWRGREVLAEKEEERRRCGRQGRVDRRGKDY